jgi:oligopeptide transport system ATP-binding protein
MRKRFQMIFQDPYASLNPRMTVGKIIAEPLEAFGIAKGKEKVRLVHELLELVGMDPSYENRYPHEFSGGQRQRIGIARALAIHPEFVVCDEPISSLDVSIQAQIVSLLKDLQAKYNLTYLFIAHDLSMVRHISDRVAVMYLGKIVEITDSLELYENPLHPYTQALLSAIPIPDPVVEEERHIIPLKGELPSPSNPPQGCKFNPRCPFVMEICRKEEPVMREVSPNHSVACHLFDPSTSSSRPN